MALEEKLRSMEITLTKVEERSKSNTKRIDEIDTILKENNNLIGAIKELAVETKYMRADLNETIQRLAKLENKEADKWDKFKWIALAGLITVFIGFIAAEIGLR